MARPSVLRPLGRAALAKHGYTNIKVLTTGARHNALRAAAAEHGWFSVHRALNAMYVSQRQRDPAAAAVIKEDVLYAAALSDR